MREYLIYVRDEARKRFDAGLSVEQAARDIALGEYRGWLDRERIAVNVDTLYREFSGGAANPSPANLFALIATLAAMAIVMNEAVRRGEIRSSRWRA